MEKTLTRLRPFRSSDAEKLVKLLVAARAWPPPNFPTPDDIINRWSRWHVDPNGDVTVLPGEDDELIAYSRASLLVDSTSRISTEIAVHPQHRRQGIGSALLELVEERARNLKTMYITSPVFMPVGETHPEATSFLGHRGFSADKSYWQMRLDDLARQDKPSWPSGFTYRRFDANNEDSEAERWASLIRDAFEERTTASRVLAQLAEPGSCHEGYIFAVDVLTGLEVGTSRGRIDTIAGEPMGYVGTVGVLPEYRGRGIAHALVLQTIEYLVEHGASSATLFVEGANERARRLYSQMGWHPTYQTLHFWKSMTRKT